MKRRTTWVVASVSAAAMLLSAGSALAKNDGPPPSFSGNPDGTYVIHCKNLSGGTVPGLAVVHPDGTLTGDPACVAAVEGL